MNFFDLRHRFDIKRQHHMLVYCYLFTLFYAYLYATYFLSLFLRHLSFRTPVTMTSVSIFETFDCFFRRSIVSNITMTSKIAGKQGIDSRLLYLRDKDTTW